MWKCPLEIIKGKAAMGQLVLVNDISTQRRGDGMGNISEGILSSFLKSKKKERRILSVLQDLANETLQERLS